MGVSRNQTWHRKDGVRMRGAYRYYQCQSRINRNQCEYRTQRAPELEAHVVKAVLRPSPEVSYAEDPASGPSVDDRSAAQARLRALDRRFAEWVQRAGDGAITVRQLRLAVEDVEAQRRVVRDRLALVEGDPSLVRAWRAGQRQRLEGEWDALGATDRQEVMRSLVARVTATDGQVDVVLRG